MKIIFLLSSFIICDLLFGQAYNKLNGKWHGTSTIDNYRNYLTHAGYLKIERPGAYKIMHEVSANMTYAKLVKEAYPKSEWTQKYKF